MDNSRTKQQLDRYEGFLAQNPGNSNLICQISQLKLQLGQLDEARQVLVDALKTSPHRPGTKIQLFQYPSRSGRIF
jgi:hypothetical protein